ncbi:MAG: hypothetical protein CR963_00415 [Gammaproteobacteria bacterium]|nr:MAG: hypothetical protein CR963_00415 [Gammaproteobacteria bacterium]
MPEGDKRKLVEPDLLLRFGACDVLVEVKPPEGGMQRHEQWEREIEGYFFAQDDTKELYFLAIGQLGNALSSFNMDLLREKHKRLKTLKTQDWQPVAHQIYQLKKTQQLDTQDRRIVEDMLQALELYGVRAYELKWSDIKTLYAKQILDMNAISAWV